jgi:hypothetical protein
MLAQKGPRQCETSEIQTQWYSWGIWLAIQICGGSVNKGNLCKDLRGIMRSTWFALTPYTYFISLQKFFGHFLHYLLSAFHFTLDHESNESKSVTMQDAKLS